MSEKIMLQVVGKTLIPANKYAEETVAAWPNGSQILVEARRPRNPAHHRKVLAMIHYLTDSTDYFPSVDKALETLKWNAGIFKTTMQWNRRRQEMEPKETLDSISFASMTQDKFEQFAAASIDFIAELTRDEPENVKRNLESYY
jgi:hypothetical protein